MLEAQEEEFKFLSPSKMRLRKLIKDKRGLGLRDLYPVIIIITIVAILLGIMLLVFEEWKEVTNTISVEVLNETLPTVSEVGDVAALANYCGFDNFDLFFAQNATGPEPITGGPLNYSFDADTGVVKYVGEDVMAMNSSDWNISYTFDFGGKDCEAIADVTSDFLDFIPWVGIILLVVAAAIVLGIVIRSFKGQTRV